jgi:hypothetical protein
VKVPIPVRYEMKGYNSLLGSHYDHYYLEYEWYSVDTPSADVFKVADSKFSFLVSDMLHLYKDSQVPT